MRRARAAGVLAVQGLGVMSAALLVPAAASGQGGDCELARVGGVTYRARFDSVNFVYHASGGVDYRCADGTRILADSAVVFESNEQVQLFGRVHIEDADMELDADTAYYFGGLQQLNAWSNVTVTDRQSGAIITGHRVSIDRATEVRPMDRMVVYEGNPHATVFPVLRAEVVESAEVADSAEVTDSVEVTDSTEAVDSVAAADSGPASDSTAAQPGEPSADTTAEAEAPGPTEPPELPEDTVAAGDALAAEDTEAVDDTEVVEDIDAAGDTVVADTEPIRLPPYEIDADQFVLEGSRYFRAAGNVIVERDSLLAEGDSLDYDQEVGAMSIFGDARVEGQSYELTASTISVTPTSGLREELLARRDARLSGQDVDMVAPAIRMFLESGQVNRLVAIGEIPPLPGEPRTVDTEGLSAGDAARVLALAEQAVADADSAAADSLFRPSVSADQFSLIGDSIDVLSPGQVLDLVTAVGAARAEGLADDTLEASGLPEIARRDWMEGDTVIADFSTGEPADSSRNAPADSAQDTQADSAQITQNTQITQNDASEAPEPDASSEVPDSVQRSRLETITAVGTARSLYRMIDPDTAQAGADTVPADPDALQAQPADPDRQPDAADPAPSDSAAAPAGSDTIAADEPARPALHWVEGEKIIVHLEGREVVSMDVEGQTVGYHLEPRPPGDPADSAAVDSMTVAADSAAADSTTAPADSATANPDTATANPDTATAHPDTATAHPDTATAPPSAATPTGQPNARRRTHTGKERRK